MNDHDLTYKGYTPILVPENGEWHGRIAGIRAIETFEGANYEAAIEDFKRAVDFYLETEPNPEIPFSGRITFQLSPEDHAELVKEASSEGVTDISAWIARKVLHNASKHV